MLNAWNMKKSVSKNTLSNPKTIVQDKQDSKSDPVAMVELRGQIISDYNQSIRNFNESHK